SRRLCENRGFWAYPPPVSPDSPFGRVPSSSDLPGCAEVLRTGRFLPVFVAELGCVEGVEVGLGLFAAEGIAKNSILGEYTGVLRLFDGKDSAYSYALPVVDPDLVIDAKDFGNLCRLINHSEDWNAELVAVHHENMLHVVCRAAQDIAPNQQILIHYGPGYWCAEGLGMARVASDHGAGQSPGPTGDQRPLSACRAYARRANEASGCRLVDRFKPSLPVILGPEHEVPLPALSHAKALAERSRAVACGGVLAHAGDPGPMMRNALLALLPLAGAENVTVPYTAPDQSGLHFVETFDGDVWSRWKHSTSEKYTSKFVVDTRAKEALVGDLALKVPEPARHYGAAVKFPPISGDSFAVQFEAKFEDGLTCGGSYLKLFDSEGKGPEEFDADTRYVIMFGPDRCGGTNKVHFILQHKNPVSGKWEEKHWATPPSVPSERRTHLYGLFIRPDNSVEMYVDGEMKASGSLLKDMQPPVNPPKEIDDPSDSKPADWVDLARIDDPEAKKPDDWDEDAPFQIPDPASSMPSGWLEDEPLKIADPSSKRPTDWDDEEDGEWEAPVISNPKCSVGCGKWEAPKIANPEYKGKWYAPKIENPAYIGEWKPRQIDNPEYFVDESPNKIPTIDSVGIDIWTMDKGILFDNIVLDSNPEKVMEFGKLTFNLRSEIEIKQEPAPSTGGFLEQSLDWALNNPVKLLMTVLALLGGSFLLCCRGGGVPPPPPASGEPSPQRKKLREYGTKARSDSPSGKKRGEKEGEASETKAEPEPASSSQDVPEKED
ncbi:unnamed protein product, partial [Effrenium voratum]